MLSHLIDSENFKGIDFSKERLPIGEYDQCTFINCSFENSDISNCVFIDCEFKDCNLSNCLTKHTLFQEVRFEDCKLIGVKFADCNDFLLDFNFKQCQLNFSSFYKLKMIGTKFDRCKLQEADFTDANLSKCTFNNSDLYKTIFDNSNLSHTDFKTTINYTIDPEINILKGAKFSKTGIEGLLRKYSVIIE
ncbi:pentapeptide repeat-containing protein [Urechidicola vernalis]|uniref:Pentapeptide repeat-containing protein n=1 Tax=Urechidicola vernalis TaxID=3075600 RepID=A0ABU2Y1Y9_9FLAO|nr:pentapeptide repeat-containing protein [Urechidicola sp. P050]MDT0552166.1 pentapeptide repeat-containing protein [Urechidicola sp. P050]